MSTVVFYRALSALYALAFLVAAWRLVVNASEGDWGWVAGMAACCVVDAALCLWFAKGAGR